MTSSAFLAQYGIAESSLSPEVKGGINDVLGAATKAGLEQLGKILQREAQKRGLDTGGGPVDTAAENEAVRVAKEEYDAQQAAKQKRQRTLLLMVAGGVLLVGIVIAVVVTKKRKNQ